MQLTNAAVGGGDVDGFKDCPTRRTILSPLSPRFKFENLLGAPAVLCRGVARRNPEHGRTMAANAPPSVSVDEGGEIVLNRFYDFLAKFTSSAEGTTDGTEGVQLYRDYLAQIAAMVENEKNTVYVDVQHVFAVSERAVLCYVSRN